MLSWGKQGITSIDLSQHICRGTGIINEDHWYHRLFILDGPVQIRKDSASETYRLHLFSYMIR